MSTRLAVVTASIDYSRALPVLTGWYERAAQPIDLYVVHQAGWNRDWQKFYEGPTPLTVYTCKDILGVVHAFAIGVRRALHDGANIIACLHDDLEIEQDGWDEDVVRLFKACPRAGLCGFGGAKGLGSDDLYQVPYNPMQLARQNFGSNMRHAEVHGMRWEHAQPAACLDGFSQIGLREFWLGGERLSFQGASFGTEPYPSQGNLFEQMQAWGVTHHFYDGMLGCFAKRLGWQVWYLPITCHHHGGMTAVADPRYHAWANRYAQQTDRLEGIEEEGTGDQIFWLRSHRIGYEQFRDVLPIRT